MIPFIYKKISSTIFGEKDEVKISEVKQKLSGMRVKGDEWHNVCKEMEGLGMIDVRMNRGIIKRKL